MLFRAHLATCCNRTLWYAPFACVDVSYHTTPITDNSQCIEYYSNMTSFFRFVKKRGSYPFGIISKYQNFNWEEKGCTVRLWTILKLSIQLIDWIYGMNSLLLEYKENYCKSSNQCIQMLERVFQFMVFIHNFSQITLVLCKGR